ncbi:MAG: NAD(P)/FAD-dependent oxidoreductase [Acidobacteriota bacterium]
MNPKASGSFGDRPRAVVVGAGLAGSMMAIYLGRAGYGVDVYERRADLRAEDQDGGRSINLGLSARGLKALERAGLKDHMLERAVVMAGRVVHRIDGGDVFQPYGKDQREVLHSIDRQELNRILMTRAETAGEVRIHFRHRLKDLDKSARTLTFEDLDTGAEETVEAPLVIGADGAFSTVRQKLHVGERADFQQEFLPWGYKELTLPADPGGRSRVKLDALHVWPRGQALIVTHPNRDGSHTVTLFLPFEGGRNSFEALRRPADVERLFAEQFPDLPPLMPDLVEQFFDNPVGRLVTTRTQPWFSSDWAVLLGDACHAVYPFYGQGMNSALEDCVVLADLLQGRRHGFEEAFRRFQARRKIHTDTLAELSKQNFLELSSHLRSPAFVLRKKLDVWLNRLFPELWKPLYSQVAHTTVPYADAVARSQRQERYLGLAAGALGLLGAVWLSRGRRR